MAVEKQKTETALIYKLEQGTNGDGEQVYSNKTIANINPSLTETDVYTLGKAVAGLQKYPLASVSRRDTSILEDTATA